jgi:hypothetical protein
MTPPVARGEAGTHPFSTVRAVEQTGEKRFQFFMPYSGSSPELQLLLDSQPQLLVDDGRLFAGVYGAFVADLTYI